MLHTHKLIYIALLLLLPLTVSSAGFRTEPFAGINEQPNSGIVQANAFKSVSPRNFNQQTGVGWRVSSYSVPFAAQEIMDGTTTAESYFEIEMGSASGPRRLPKPDYEEENPGQPIGDIPWIMMLILGAGYCVYRCRRLAGYGEI